MRNLHIICGGSAGAILKNVFAEEESNDNNEVHHFFEALNVGELFESLTLQGLQKRIQFADENYYEFPDYAEVFLAFFEHPFDSYDSITLWHTDNACDKLMLYLICWYFQEQQIEVPLYEIYMDETAFLNLYPYGRCSFGLLPPEKLTIHIHDGKPISKDAFLNYVALWNNWRKSDSTLRIWKEGKVIALPENHFDEYIVSFCSSEFIRTVRLIGECLGYINYPIGDHFFHSRIQKLVRQGALISDNDNLNDMRGYSVKVRN